MIFKGKILGDAQNFQGDPYLNDTTIPFDTVHVAVTAVLEYLDLATQLCNKARGRGTQYLGFYGIVIEGHGPSTDDVPCSDHLRGVTYCTSFISPA